MKSNIIYVLTGHIFKNRINWCTFNTIVKDIRTMQQKKVQLITHMVL